MRALDARHSAYDKWASRLAPALGRLIADQARLQRDGQARLAQLAARLDAGPAARFETLSRRLDALDRIRQTLGYHETLKRGFAVVRGDGAVVTSRHDAAKAAVIDIEFHDGSLRLGGAGDAGPSVPPAVLPRAQPVEKPAKRSAKPKAPPEPEQGFLF